MGVVGAALRGFGKALRAHRIKHGKRGPDIKSVKPLSGKVPWYVGARPNTAASRSRILKTHAGLERSKKVEDAEKAIKEGKEKLKHLKDTGQAEKIGGSMTETSSKGVLRLTTTMVLLVGFFGLLGYAEETREQQVERLIKQLQDADSDVRSNAAMALREIGESAKNVQF